MVLRRSLSLYYLKESKAYWCAYWYHSVGNVRDFISVSSHLFWYRFGTELLPLLQVLCEGKPTVTDGLSSQKDSNAEFWSFLWYLPEQTIDSSVIWDATVLICHHCNDVMASTVCIISCLLPIPRCQTAIKLLTITRLSLMYDMNYITCHDYLVIAIE